MDDNLDDGRESKHNLREAKKTICTRLNRTWGFPGEVLRAFPRQRESGRPKKSRAPGLLQRPNFSRCEAANLARTIQLCVVRDMP
jgi:hypothetical protein